MTSASGTVNSCRAITASTTFSCNARCSSCSRRTRAEADHGVVDLGQDVARADQELVAGLARRVVAVDGERVVDHDEIAGGRRTLDRVELRLLLAHVVERGGEVVGGDRRRRVL